MAYLSTPPLFISSTKHKQQFIEDIESTIIQLEKNGIDKGTIIEFIDNLSNGLNSQIYNAPLDLFIEYYLYNTFPELRPYQFLSLYRLTQDYLRAVNGVREIEFSPVFVREANTIMILLNIFQFRDLYGMDLLSQYKASDSQLKTARELYRDYMDHRLSRKPADEYDMVQSWARILKLDKYFNLFDENEYRKKTVSSRTSQSQNKIDSPIYTSEELLLPKNKEILPAKDPAEEMAITMYCLSALEMFKDRSPDEIRSIGFEIGLLGQSGIDPNDRQKQFTLNSLPNKEFSGLQLLCIMYVAFQSIDPELDLYLDFHSEYENAKTLFREKYSI